RGGERDVGGGGFGRGELDHGVRRLDQGRRVVVRRDPDRVLAGEGAEVLTERRVVALVDPAGEGAAFGGEHLTDYRAAHPAGAAQNTDSHGRLPRLPPRGSMRAPACVSRRSGRPVQKSPRARRSAWISWSRASTSAALRPARARRDDVSSTRSGRVASSVLNRWASSEKSCASRGSERSAWQISVVTSRPHSAPNGSMFWIRRAATKTSGAAARAMRSHCPLASVPVILIWPPPSRRPTTGASMPGPARRL